MSINRIIFYDRVRSDLFMGRLSQYQVDGMNVILDEWERRGLTDLRWLAYMLATVKWETAHTMQPIAEYGQGRGYPYGRRDPETGQIYYGRGFVQLTWKRNYECMGRLLDLDLVGNPDLALSLGPATQILFEGMLRGDSEVGDFTGMALEDCFNDETEDWVKARRIINGTDRADEIAGIGRRFHAALVAATAEERSAA
jgi:putative chitinase